VKNASAALATGDKKKNGLPPLFSEHFRSALVVTLVIQVNISNWPKKDYWLILNGSGSPSFLMLQQGAIKIASTCYYFPLHGEPL